MKKGFFDGGRGLSMGRLITFGCFVVGSYLAIAGLHLAQAQEVVGLVGVFIGGGVLGKVGQTAFERRGETKPGIEK